VSGQPIVEPLTPGDEGPCEEIERLAFGSNSLDLPTEARREMARIWVARPASGAAPQAFLLAWVVLDELEILSVATHPAARRQGAGRALIDRALAEARGARCRRLLLEVRRSNEAAIALYRAVGFHIAGRRRRYYPDNNEDALLMNLDLAPDGAIVPGVDDLD
jgi:ribosomal-protein-alanine N-acetyltransferase